MNLLSGFWRRLRAADAAQHSRFLDAGTDFQQSRMPGESSQSQKAVRKDLLRMVLRTTLHRNGIPTQWIGADALTASSRENVPGLHVRFVVRHWDPRLGLHAPAFQDDFARRLLAFDPLSAQWIRGYSWRYDLPDPGVYPALPHPGSWTAEPRAATLPRQRAAGSRPESDPIISGPVVIDNKPVRAGGYVVTQPSPLVQLPR